jgi:hypothetical protein
MAYKLILEKTKFLIGVYASVDANLIANAHVQFALRTVIRLCKSSERLATVYGAVRSIMADPDLKRDIKHYIPYGGDSRVLPKLLSLGMPLLATLYLRYWK